MIRPSDSILEDTQKVTWNESSSTTTTIIETDVTGGEVAEEEAPEEVVWVGIRHKRHLLLALLVAEDEVRLGGYLLKD